MGEAATSTIGLGIIFDMPPQVKCFLFDSSPYTDSRTYHLVATGMGRPIPGSSDELIFYTRFYCEKGLLSERVCEPYRGLPSVIPVPKAKRQVQGSSTLGKAPTPGKAVPAPEAAMRAKPQKPQRPKTVDPGTNPVMVQPAYPVNAPR